MELLEKLWLEGGGDKPIHRSWDLQPQSGGFDKAYDKIQDELENECGADDFLTGTLLLLFYYCIHFFFIIVAKDSWVNQKAKQ